MSGQVWAKNDIALQQFQIRFWQSAPFGKAPPPLEYVQHYQSSLLQVLGLGGPLLANPWFDGCDSDSKI